jgi:hypothetical protein
MNIVDENWLDVKGYLGVYQVSDYGRIKSLDRFSPHVCGGESFRKGRILKAGKDGHGYLQVCLCFNRDKKTAWIHQLVAQAFLGDRPQDCVINHIDGERTNNRLNNLEYCTRSENCQHAFAMGLNIAVKGSDHYRAKLTELQVLEICRLYDAGGVTHRELAQRYGVCHRSIGLVIRNLSWKHISR